MKEENSSLQLRYSSHINGVTVLRLPASERSPPQHNLIEMKINKYESFKMKLKINKQECMADWVSELILRTAMELFTSAFPFRIDGIILLEETILNKNETRRHQLKLMGQREREVFQSTDERWADVNASPRSSD